jgi:hypothetical protein
MKPEMYQRQRGVFSALLIAVILTVAAVLGSGSPATAADLELVFPAGIACEDFDLKIEITGSTQVFKEFTDRSGEVVRKLSAGKGSALVFTNLLTEATFSTKSNGTALHVTFNPDGSRTEVATGHNVIILFPTDEPAGPSTTLHVGRVVYTVEEDEVFTLQQVSGKRTDICAALSE